MQTKPTTLPARVDSSMLAKYLQAGEPVIVAKLVGVGNTAAYDFRDRGNRVYVFRWESQQGGHILRVPLSLWNADKGRIAHDIMDQRGMLRPIVVTVEVPSVQADSLDSQYVQALGMLSTLVPDMVIDASNPLRMAQTIYDTFKSQAGQVAKSSGSYPGNAGSTPAPATNQRSAIVAFVKAADLNDADWPETAMACVTDAHAKGYLEAKLQEIGAAVASSDEDFRDQFLKEIDNVFPEMDATAADSAPNVVGQGEEAPVASASAPSAPDAPLVASGQIMHKDQPMYSAAWDKLGSPMRIKALAALLDTDEETLKTAIQDPLSTVELGHAGWVKRREPQA